MQLKRARYSGMVPAVINAARLGYRAYQGYGAVKRKFGEMMQSKQPVAPTPVTTQFDTKTLYRRKRASRAFRRKARRYRSFVKKSIGAVDTRNEKQRVLFYDNFRMTTTANTQGCFLAYFNLYGGNTGTAGMRDLYNMETGLGDAVNSMTRTYYRSALMEVAIKNTDATNGMYVDVYYYTCRKDFKPSVSFQSLFDGSFTNLPTNMGGLSQTGGTYGASPFLAKEWTGFFKIFKKTTTLLGAGNQMDFTLSKKKNFVVEFAKVNDYGALKGLTIGCVVIIYGLPNSAVDGTAGQPLATGCNVNVTRSYTLTSNRPGLVDAGASVLTS